MTKPIFKTCFILFVGIAQALADDQLNVDLFSAVYEKDIQAVDNLLGKGANVDAKNRLGFTPLMLTGDPVMASYLIKRGAVVDFETTNNLTALLISTTSGTKSMVAVLVESGANIDRVGQFDMTPIMRACSSSKFDSVVYLANKGENVNIEQKDGNTALMKCIVSASTILKNQINEKGVIEADEMYGAKMATALDAIKSLIENGAKLDARRVNLIDGTKEITPLGAALRLNRQEVIDRRHQAMAAESEVSFGVGTGALYSGIGVNAGLKSENDFKYIAAGCIGIGLSTQYGWALPCGIGAGWIWTGLLSKEDNRNGFGIYVGPVGINIGNTVNEDKARYGLGITYVYFLNGISSNGWNFGITPAIGEENGNNKGSLLLNVGYLF